MRASSLTRHLRRLGHVAIGAALVASTSGAFAQPPSPTAPPSSHQRPKRTASSAMSPRPGGVIDLACLAGKQALVGLHAASDKTVARDAAGRPMLALTTLNRGESVAIPASGIDGGFISADLDRVAHLLRAASGEEHPIDPRTLSLVYRLETHFGVPEIRVVSGYRLPKPGSRSNHGKGRALDIIVPGVTDEDVARFVRDVGFVGVGVYPASQFVHVDVRPRSYFWIDFSGPHARNRERGILADLAARNDAAAIARGEPPVEPFGIATDVESTLKARRMNVAPVVDEEEDEEN